VKPAQERRRQRVHLQQYLGDLIAQVDAAHVKADQLPEAAQYHVQCTTGCAHAEAGCCSLIVLTETTEAEYIVARNRAAVVRAYPKLVEHVRRIESELGYEVLEMFADREVERRAAAAYHAMRMPCAFLDDARRCTIYRDRPLACRTHFVLSDPALCSSEADEEPDHTTLDKGTRVSSQAHLCHEVARVRGVLGMGTLPQSVLSVLTREQWP
jgi:Fe-S-cluster containining protein